MNYLNLETNEMRGPQFTMAPAQERGSWLSMMLYAVATENGGVLTGCGLWTERQWMKVCGLTFEELYCDEVGNPICDTTLWHWVNNDLYLWGFPHDKLAQVEAGREGGKKGGRPKKATSPTPENPPENPPEKTEKPSPKPERKGMEGNRREMEEEENRDPVASLSAPSLASAQDSPCPDSSNDPTTRTDEPKAGSAMLEKKKGAVSFPDDFPEDLQPALLTWAEDKTRRKQAYTPQGFVLLCHRVQNLGINGPRLQALVNESIERGWKGIVEVHFKRDSGGSQPGFQPQKKEGGAGMPVNEELLRQPTVNARPAEFEAACMALYGRIPQPWALMGIGEQSDVLAWCEKERRAK